VQHTAANNYGADVALPAHYHNRVTCLRKKIPWRPSRGFNSSEPRIYGLQTAIVVGPKGTEIHSDEYGRVRVQFHWDREGKFDEKSSAWVRVASTWAGSNFGFIAVPRIGQEVLVQFLDGNPDRPLITGRVYNAANMPPWELPAHQTQTGILTRSSQGGGYENANALRFEDKKGSEEVWLHAEKNQRIEVEHDESHWVGHDRNKVIDHDELVQVKHDRFNNIDVNHTEKIGSNHTETIGANHKQTIGKNQAIKIGKNLTETVGMANIQNVGLAKVANIGLGYAINVGAGYSVNVGGLANFVVGGAFNEQVGKSRGISAGDNVTVNAGKTMSLTGVDKITANGKEVFIEGSTKLVLAVGASTITMTPGEININAPMVKINCPAAPSSALAANAPQAKESTGLGPEVDDIAAKSPTLQKDLAELKKDGWVIKEGPAGGGSHANRDTKVITLDSNLKSNPKEATQVLAHEVGHAKHPFVDDRSSKAAYLKGTLGDEGAATMKNIQVQREIYANSGKSIDIGIAGNAANHPSYNAAYDQYLKDGNASAARDKVGQIFGNGERVSGPNNPTYNEYYGGWYDSVYGAKP
jgi:type VI secretion system secreted protein VgrG